MFISNGKLDDDIIASIVNLFYIFSLYCTIGIIFSNISPNCAIIHPQIFFYIGSMWRAVARSLKVHVLHSKKLLVYLNVFTIKTISLFYRSLSNVLSTKFVCSVVCPPQLLYKSYFENSGENESRIC